MSDLVVEIYSLDGPQDDDHHIPICTAIESLLRLLGQERVIQLANLVDDVCQKTGWGGVDIVVAEGRVATIKQNISYK